MKLQKALTGRLIPLTAVMLLALQLSACPEIPERQPVNYRWAQIENQPDCLIADVLFAYSVRPSDETLVSSPNFKVNWSGRCADGKAEGHGKLVIKYRAHKNWIETVYEGDMRNGLKHGKGADTWPSGDKYVGDFSNGTWTGHGTFIGHGGDRYSGEWTRFAQHGPGKATYPDGNELDGIWVHGNFSHGRALMIWPNGDQYAGGYADGHMEGGGTYTFANGDTCSGNWHKDALVGAGDGVSSGQKTVCFGNRETLHFKGT